MRTRCTKIRHSLASFLLGLLAATGCTCSHNSVDGSRLYARLTGANSPEEIEAKIRKELTQLYRPEDLSASYSVRMVTNGAAQWMIVRAANGPRGLYMFNLYCYEQRSSNTWLLRAYVPVNGHYYTNSSDNDIHITTEEGVLKVIFRGEAVFTGA